jgi:hypothetical protein
MRLGVSMKMALQLRFAATTAPFGYGALNVAIAVDT